MSSAHLSNRRLVAILFGVGVLATCILLALYLIPHRTVVVSRALRAHYLRQYGQETVYIPNGISPPVYRSPRLIREQGIDGEYLLFVGRLVPEKGCHLLLEAYSQLPAVVRERYGLAIAGDAGFTAGYAEQLHRMAPAEARFLGYVHGEILDELYSNAALVVLPSTLEGLSITLLEGMSYGRCCLVSDIPPNLEVAGAWAQTFRSGEVADLLGQLTWILDQPETRQRLAEGAQRHVLENYSWDQVADQTAAVYRGLVT